MFSVELVNWASLLPYLSVCSAVVYIWNCLEYLPHFHSGLGNASHSRCSATVPPQIPPPNSVSLSLLHSQFLYWEEFILLFLLSGSLCLVLPKSNVTRRELETRDGGRRGSENGSKFYFSIGFCLSNCLASWIKFLFCVCLCFKCSELSTAHMKW